MGPEMGAFCLASTIILAIWGSVARGVARSAREVVEAGVAEEFEAVDELIGGLAGDAKAPGEVGDGVAACCPSGDEGAALA